MPEQFLQHLKSVQEVTLRRPTILTLVFLTHNHFPGEKVPGGYQGISPFLPNGKPVRLTPESIDAYGGRSINLDPISDSWSRDTSAYHVMLKTLQQARMEGIWIPALEYFYKWGDEIFRTERGSRRAMGHISDIGIFTLSPHLAKSNRQRYIPSQLLMKTLSESEGS